MQVSLSLLGPMEVTWAGQPVTFATTAARALLSYLALEADRPQSRELLATLLWPDQSQAAAYTNLRQSLARVRKALPAAPAPELLQITQQTLQFQRAAATVDVAHFAELLAACAVHAHGDLAGCPACLQRLEQAADLYRGELLHGLFLEHSQPFEEWLLVRREALHRQALDVLQTLARAYEAAADYQRMRRYAARLLALEPWREDVHAQVMRAMVASGDRAGALAQFAHCRKVLADELGVEPDGEARALYARLLAGDLPPATDDTAAPRHNLPAALTPFVGREAELAALAAFGRQGDARLATLVGVGGMGKTRLALEAARASLGAYADGVFFVALAPLASAEAIVPAIVQALGVTLDGSDLPAALLRWVRDKHLLLILDNFEHVLAGVGLVVELLAAAPRAQIIATSRERLNVRGEQVYGVEGLEYGRDAPAAATASSAAMRLLIQGARRAQPDFRVRAAELPALQRICALVGGMPLGLELAAAWIGVVAPEEIAREIARDVDFLEARWSDAPERQRSMRAVFDWSWRLLGDAERRVLRQLSVFRGGFTREGAETIAGATLRVLAGLHHKSLLHWRPADGAAGRYEIHELLRQFAAEQLAAVPDEQIDSTRRRHAAYYLQLAKEAAPELAGGPEQIAWFGRVAVELDNFRAVLHWAVEHREVATALRLGTALREFWMTRGYLSEGRGWLEAALALADQAADPVSDALRGSALTTTGWLAANARDFPAAERMFEQSLALARRAEDPRQIIAVLGDLGQAARMQHDPGRAVALYEERVVLSRELGDSRGLAWALCNLGMIAYTEGDPRVGYMLEEAVANAQSSGDQVCVAWCLTFLARVAKDRGEHAQAAAIFADSLRLFRDLGHADGIAYTLQGCAGLAATRGDFHAAARLFGAAEALREVINRRQAPDRFDLAAADAVRDGAPWHADWAEGRTLPVEQAIVYALAQNEAPRASKTLNATSRTR